jgi:hypothetical protein
MQRRNNLLFSASAAALGFLSAMPLKWGTISDKTQWPVPLHITGFSGIIKFLVDLPIWFVLIVSIVATLIAALNLLNVTSIPKAIAGWLLIVCEAFYLRLVFATDSSFTVSIGPFVASLATALALFAVFGSTTVREDLDEGLKPHRAAEED